MGVLGGGVTCDRVGARRGKVCFLSFTSSFHSFVQFNDSLLRFSCSSFLSVWSPEGPYTTRLMLSPSVCMSVRLSVCVKWV